MQQRQRTIDLADLFGNIVNQLQNDRQQINEIDHVNRNHGDNALHNFQVIERTLQSNRGRTADEQLRLAAEALERQGNGSTASLYASGLREAAPRFTGQQGIGIEDLLPLLQGILGGIQGRTSAQQGQGTLLDSLLPAVMAFAGARNSGRGMMESIGDALSASRRGAQQTFNQPSLFGRQRGQNGSWRDPGAASANSFLEGLFRTFMG